MLQLLNVLNMLTKLEDEIVLQTKVQGGASASAQIQQVRWLFRVPLA
jgi:hypothetical protein